ncbi:hypothetical protein GCM10018954_029230 [Kutzneria kofuensis]
MRVVVSEMLTALNGPSARPLYERMHPALHREATVPAAGLPADGVYSGRDALGVALALRRARVGSSAAVIRVLDVSGARARAELDITVRAGRDGPTHLHEVHELTVDSRFRQVTGWTLRVQRSGATRPPGDRDEESGLTPLMSAAGRGDLEAVRELLDSGADIHTMDTRGGGTALHKAVQGGHIDVVRLLLDRGAFLDATTPTTGHTPLLDAFWYKHADVAELLLERGAGINLTTHYGFSMRDHIDYALKANALGDEKLRRAEEALNRRLAEDERKVAEQKLMAATVAGDVAEVRALLAAGADTEERSPVLNGFNDWHTPLLVAARDGHREIVEELIAAGADVNAVEPTFGAVPLHKAVYNGHADITAVLVRAPGADIDFRGATNGYTPLHDALWHGHEECARVLIDAGARQDLRGHEGALPVDIAADVFGPEHELTRLLAGKR